MLSRLRQGAIALGEQAAGTSAFLLSRINPDGGFQGRTGKSDLYYTAFGIDLLMALHTLPFMVHDSPLTAPIADYIIRFGSGDNLAFMDLVSLARARTRLMPDQAAPEWRQAIANHISRFRTANGGYDSHPGSTTATATATYMAWIALEAIDIEPENPSTIISALQLLQTPDGAYSNLPGMPVGNTPSTAAAQVLLHHFGLLQPAPPPSSTPICHSRSLPPFTIHNSPLTPRTVAWMLDQLDDSGGFRAFPQAPIPDLLSTGTALFALSCLATAATLHSEPEIVTACHSFIASRRTPSGGYCGHAFDTVADVEYTYYALLALGSLSTIFDHAQSVH